MTREEAIKVASEMYGWLKTDREREALETLIPELTKSEDERMMREFNDWLCEEIECLTNDLRDEKDRRTFNMLCYVLTKVKDWLEKKKEQKPWKVGANAYFTPEQKPADLSEMMVHKEPYIAPVPTPMVADEQKSAEWSKEEYGGRLFDIEHYLDGTLQLSPDRRITCIDFLKSLRSQSHWKPSEHQMTILKNVKDYVGKGSGYWGEGLGSLIDDLEKLM